MTIKRASATREDTGRRQTKDEDDDRYAYDDDDERPRGRARDRDDEDDDRDERRPPRRARDDDDDRDDDRRDRRPSRRRDEDDEEDDRGSRRPRARDEDEDAEDRGRGRSRSRDRDDDREDDRRPRRDRDEEPRGRRARDDDEDEPVRSRVKRRERDDDDDRGRDRDDDRGASRKRDNPSVKDGWEGGHKIRDSSGDFAAEFKPEADKSYVIKFLDEKGSFASYRQHWLERSGKKSFVCPEDPEDDQSPRCPLCDAGDRVRAQYAFNVIVLEEDAKPVVKAWNVGIRLFNKLEKIHKDSKIGPLTDPYFAVTRTGKGTNSDTQLTPIKARDLWDDYGIEELTDKELDGLKRKGYDKSIIDVPSRKQLNELADEMTKYDDR